MADNVSILGGKKDADFRRIQRLIERLTTEYQLNLKGLTVYTEAASGHYVNNAVLTALTGAEHVFAYTRDSSYATAKDVAERTMSRAKQFGVTDKVEVVFKKEKDQIKQCDIVTNTGFVRPFNTEFISWLKPTAIVPLMWETWEFRPDEFDINLCQQKGIAVIGTNESTPPCDMALYNGFTALKLLFALGFEGYKTNVLLLGSSPTPGGAIYKQLSSIGVSVTWFSSSPDSPFQYRELSTYFEQHGKKYDAIILGEHHHRTCLLGSEGYLSFEKIKEVNPDIEIGIVSGNVQIDELKKSGLRHLPEKVMPFGFMSYQPYELGPRPVMELFAAGLKVGEIAARARLSGKSVEETIKATVDYGIGHDFEGGFLNYKADV